MTVNTATTPSSEPDARDAMNRMYRATRHVYNLTRKFYLLGRDHLVRNLDAKPGEQVCEIGCGTARNLIKMGDAYPDAIFSGIDASDEMLATARASLKRNGHADIKVEQGYAQSFDPEKTLGIKGPFDKVVFSYALSIIPPWRESIDHALKLLKKGGEMHIVDFGGQEHLPDAFRKVLFAWLAMFHVEHKPEVFNYLQLLEREKQGSLHISKLFRGYAHYAVFKKAADAPIPPAL